MIQVNTRTANKILNSKKDFFFFNTDNNGKVTNWSLSNNYREGRKAFEGFRVVSTIKPQTELITIK